MKTLVYFASDPIKKEYHNLNFDRIYLIDYCFKRGINDTISYDGKITCVGMDCLESINYLKQENVKIDCFVSLNEGLSEGGGNYAINSDIFLGYVMPLLKDNYIHIMNKRYYQNFRGRVSMDLPYNTIEIDETNRHYISPSIFSEYISVINDAKVFQMIRLVTTDKEIIINPKIKIKLIHDSIWNYYEELDTIVISFTQQGQDDFFDKIPKVCNLTKMSMNEVFDYCEKNNIRKIGFTPWGKGFYNDFMWKIKSRKSNYPSEILLFHLNKNDYPDFYKTTH